MARRTPAEWEPQSAVQFTFPRPDGDWAPSLDEAVSCFVRIIRTAALFQDVLVVCHDRTWALRQFPADLPSTIHFVELASNDTWARDHGGLVVYAHGRPVLLDFTFNGWGEKYPAELDDLIPSRLYDLGYFRVDRHCRPGLVFEGGAIDVNGRGEALTTARCLLSPRRNPQLGRKALDRRLRHLFGLDRLIWLEHGYLQGDDTDGHIDTLARFCGPDTIAYVRCERRDDPHFADLSAMESALRALRRPDGQPYVLRPLPLPGPVRDDHGRRLPATYANFLILNGAVLVPQYDRPEDGAALRQLTRAFPGREVIGLPCRPLLTQGGSLHCTAMTYPAGVLRFPAAEN